LYPETIIRAKDNGGSIKIYPMEIVRHSHAFSEQLRAEIWTGESSGWRRIGFLAVDQHQAR
jgi:hypothetical protein